MSGIELLDNDMINKIAAGEVVERPLSIVKELAENSIDAGASAITIEIENGGLAMIRVTDNGGGIPGNQVRTAFLRHATSKIRDYDDLVNVMTLGFRGEALASIASVSQVEIITRAARELTGARMEIHGGREQGYHELGCAEGTTIITRNLFYNTPVRLNFLKKPSTEAGYISDMVNKLALGHPEISFTYINNGSQVLRTGGNGDLKTAIFYVYGREVSQKLIDLDYTNGDFRLRGYVGKPEIARGNRSFGNFFINGRYIKSELLQSAIEEGYKTMLTSGRFPLFVLHLHLPPGGVDVNVHPTKLDIRFKDERNAYLQCVEAVTGALKEHNLVPEWENKKIRKNDDRWENVKLRKDSAELRNTKVRENEPERENIIAQKESVVREGPQSYKSGVECDNACVRDSDAVYGDISVTGGTLSFREDVEAVEVADERSGLDGFLRALYPERMESESRAEDTVEDQHMAASADIAVDHHESTVSNPRDGQTAATSTEAMNHADHTWLDQTGSNSDAQSQKRSADGYDSPFLDQYRIIGQIFGTYWIIEQGESLYYIDQHAAHERAMYEDLMKGFKARAIPAQQQLQPLAVRLTPLEKDTVMENMELLTDFGFEIEDFGEQTVLVRAVPFIFRGPVSSSFFMDIVDRLHNVNTSTSDLYDAKINTVATIACKAAVKANDIMSRREAEALIKKILSLENPFTCPHGRPTIIQMSKRELEKKFKRV